MTGMISGTPLPLWPQGAPLAIGAEDLDIPTLTPYFPPSDTATGAAVVVCPGGGYQYVADDHEGRQIAAWLNAWGVAAFMLRYRLAPRYRHPAQLIDGQRAVRLVRAHAQAWGIDPLRLGIWGFSAGGHLASTVATHYDCGNPLAADPVDRENSHPEFLILAYPVITLKPNYTHMGSRVNLLGDQQEPALIDYLSNETQVSHATPPTFLFHTTDDAGVPAENSIFFYLALRRAGISAELHLYAHGPHGVGLAADDPVLSSWPDRLADWMDSLGLLTK